METKKGRPNQNLQQILGYWVIQRLGNDFRNWVLTPERAMNYTMN